MKGVSPKYQPYERLERCVGKNSFAEAIKQNAGVLCKRRLEGKREPASAFQRVAHFASFAQNGHFVSGGRF